MDDPACSPRQPGPEPDGTSGGASIARREAPSRPVMPTPARTTPDLRLLALHLVLFASLLWVYTTYVVDIFGYAGFHDALNVGKALLSPVALLAAFALLRNNGLPSYFFLNLILAFIVTPSLVLFSGSDLPFEFIAVTWTAFALVAAVVFFLRLRRLRTHTVSATRLLPWIVSSGLLLVVGILALGGARYLNFDLTRVYDFRRDASANLPGVFQYLVPTFSNAIVPSGIVLSMHYRRWGLLLLSVSCSVLLFALSSNRLPLFIPVVLATVYWFSRHPRAIDATLLALIAAVAVGGADFHLMQSGVGGLAGLFGSLGVRRALLVPSLMNWSYFDFFSVHPHTYWSDSKVTLGLVDPVYDIGIADLIGRDVFGRDMHANAGWIGSGMANAGYAGIALYSVALGLLLSLLDACARTLGYTLVLAVFLIPVLSVAVSSDLTTMLLTHGLLVLLAVVILLKPALERSPSGRAPGRSPRRGAAGGRAGPVAAGSGSPQRP